MINNKARHNLMDAKCKWRSNRLDGALSFREPLGQMKVMQIRQGETLNHQGAMIHEVCCLSAQYVSFIPQKINYFDIYSVQKKITIEKHKQSPCAK